jgi:hypothetical protein
MIMWETCHGGRKGNGYERNHNDITPNPQLVVSEHVAKTNVLRTAHLYVVLRVCSRLGQIFSKKRRGDEK